MNRILVFVTVVLGVIALKEVPVVGLASQPDDSQNEVEIGNTVISIAKMTIPAIEQAIHTEAAAYLLQIERPIYKLINNTKNQLEEKILNITSEYQFDVNRIKQIERDEQHSRTRYGLLFDEMQDLRRDMKKLAASFMNYTAISELHHKDVQNDIKFNRFLLIHHQNLRENESAIADDKLMGISDSVRIIITTQEDHTKRLDSLEHKFTQLVNLTGQHSSQLKSLTEKVDSLQIKVDNLTEKVDSLQIKVDNSIEKVDSLQIKVENLTEKVDSLQTKVDNLTEKFDVVGIGKNQTDIKNLLMEIWGWIQKNTNSEKKPDESIVEIIAEP